jgi:two-component system chemotaxis response regulator CheY
MKILIVDDEFVSRQKLCLLLAKKGQCDAAASGEEAYQMFCQAFRDNAGYQLITLDYDMPGLSGPEVLEKIRQFERENGVSSRDRWVKVMMVTGKSDSKSVMSSFKSGCEGYLTKPFNNEEIRKGLKTVGL